MLIIEAPAGNKSRAQLNARRKPLYWRGDRAINFDIFILSDSVVIDDTRYGKRQLSYIDMKYINDLMWRIEMLRS